MDMPAGAIMIFDGPGLPLRSGLRPLPALLPGEVLVRNLFTTICGSDIHTYCGLRKERMPTVLGHEIVGRIEAMDPAHCGTDYRGTLLSAGDTVTWSVFCSDPQSLPALEGMPQKGAGLFKYGHAEVTEQDVFHGGLSEYCILKRHTALLKVPEEVPLPVAATVNCSVATVAGMLRLAGSVRDRHVWISGMGMLGVTCAAMCRAAGAVWIGVADIDPVRLERAMLFGADAAFDLHADPAETISQVVSSCPGPGVQVVFDVSGAPAAMELGLDLLATGGCAVWAGAVFHTRRLAVDPEQIIRRLITIKGLHNYNFDDFQYALDFIIHNWNRFPFAGVVEKEFPLAQAEAAFAYARDHKPLRVGIRI